MVYHYSYIINDSSNGLWVHMAFSSVYGIFISSGFPIILAQYVWGAQYWPPTDHILVSGLHTFQWYLCHHKLCIICTGVKINDTHYHPIIPISDMSKVNCRACCSHSCKNHIRTWTRRTYSLSNIWPLLKLIRLSEVHKGGKQAQEHFICTWLHYETASQSYISDCQDDAVNKSSGTMLQTKPNGQKHLKKEGKKRTYSS